jgi:flavodoxin
MTGFPCGEFVKYVIIYYSRFGNNKKIVEHLAHILMKKGQVQILTADRADPVALPPADVYVFSAAAERFSIQIDMKNLMKNISGMDGKKYAIVNTHALKFKSWLGRMDKLLAKSGMSKIAEVDFRMGSGTDKGTGLADGWETKLEGFAGKI